jgi:hypothetical protein
MHYEDVNRIELAQDRVKWQALEMNSQDPLEQNFLIILYYSSCLCMLMVITFNFTYDKNIVQILFPLLL